MTDTEYIKYLEGLIPANVNINKDYLPKFQKEAKFIGGGWYEWGSQMSNNPRELILKGVLIRNGIHFKEQ